MRSAERPWRLLPADLFRFATTDLHELHVAVMAAFDEATLLQPAMNLDQVRSALTTGGWDEPADDAQLQRVLGQLAGWRLLDATQDHGANYATPEDFERKNLQWSLTPRGQAAVAGVLHALAVLGRAVSLQPAVLDAIADGLTELRALLDDSAGDRQQQTREADARIATRLAEVEGHLQSLVDNVRQFNTQLQRLLRDDATDDDVFLDVKRRTVAYLEEYITGVERPTRRVAVAIGDLEAVGVSRLFDRALVGANLAPVAGDDPVPGWLAERDRRWRALCAWFAPAGGVQPRIRALTSVARQAILQLLRVLERRWDSRRRAASVADDFRALARWFAAAPTERDAHRLFNAAFGLWPARHAHVGAADAEAVASTTSWCDAPPAEVAPMLRTTGTLTNRGGVRPVGDPAALRAIRQRHQAAELARAEATRSGLRTGGATRLSSFARLDADAFAELLALLAAALAAPLASDGSRRAASADGQVEVALRNIDDGRTAHLHSAQGTLTAPDYAVTIDLVGAPADDVDDAADIDEDRREAAGG